MRRRQFLQALGLGALAAGAVPLQRRARGATSSSSRPRFYLHVIPLGGMDAVYTTDPKTAREVEPGIDVPYAPKEIIDASGQRLGPSFADLARWMPRLAIVNMLRQNSANHFGGLAHALRMRTHATWANPALTDILGARREDEAVGAIHLGATFPSGYTPKYLGEPGTFLYGTQPGLFEHLDQADPEDLRSLAGSYRRQADALGSRRLTELEAGTRENLADTAALLERVAKAPRFAPTAWSPDKLADFPYDKDCQRALWLFEHGITRCVALCVGNMLFDTHAKNFRQRAYTAQLAALLDRLFAELDARKLADRTAVIIGSEIGRFPRINAAQGKDHFPQAPYLLFGPWFRTGAIFGGTDREAIARPVALDTGRPDAAGRLLQLDDLGTTLLALDGANPEVYGYTGAPLRFLVA
jgi:hypothetical protein